MKQWLLREAKTLLNLVPDTENILAIARQHRANFAFLFPSIAVATDKHVIVCNRWFAGLKQDISFIPYGAIVSMRVEHSIFFSTIYLRLHGSASKKDNIFDTEKEEGEIRGLLQADALHLAKAISSRLPATMHYAAANQPTAPEQQRGQSEPQSHTYLPPTYVGDISFSYSTTAALEAHYETETKVKPEELLIFKLRNQQ
ncbi:MAG: PH domain-containing protein [Candidatus Marsarchaeota archaeon]|jgi:hypothetical protein|nr:PH domain-containing protein [Candidatus Marsarchaeota archaeon]